MVRFFAFIGAVWNGLISWWGKRPMAPLNFLFYGFNSLNTTTASWKVSLEAWNNFFVKQLYKVKLFGLFPHYFVQAYSHCTSVTHHHAVSSNVTSSWCRIEKKKVLLLLTCEVGRYRKKVQKMKYTGKQLLINDLLKILSIWDKCSIPDLPCGNTDCKERSQSRE